MPLQVPPQAARLSPTTGGVEVPASSSVLVPPSGTGARPAQSLSGSWPLATAAHCPTVPGRLHDSQTPSHALSQQTPSTHWLLMHSVASVQGTPLPLVPSVMMASTA